MDIAPRLFDAYEAKTDLGFLEAKCRACVARAEAVWNQVCNAAPRLRKAARGRGRNAIFNELVADFAREEFSDDASVDLCEQFGTVRLHVNGNYDLGFKKVDKRGRAANYPTPRRKRYDEQLPLIGEPMPDAKRMHIGYQWNNAGTEIIDVYLVYPLRRDPVFMYPLAPIENQSLKIAAPAPATKTRFRSKIVKEDKKAKKAE